MANIHFYLSENSPLAQPAEFDFSEKHWKIFPYRTFGVSRILERWVVKFVTQNIEQLRPDDNDTDPIAWRIYNQRSKECQDNLESGMYGAETPNFHNIINRTDPGLAESIHQCCAWKQPEWTRELTKRLWNDPVKKEEILQLYIELNIKKKEEPIVEKTIEEPKLNQ